MNQLSPELLAFLACAFLGAGGYLLASNAAPVWDAFSKHWASTLTTQLAAVRWDTSRVPQYLRLWGLAMLAAFVVLVFVLKMWPIAIAVVYLIYISPRILMEMSLGRRRSLLRDQLVSACVTLANTTRAGLSLGQGLATTAEETSEPLSQELQHVVHEFQSGRPLAEAIQDAKDRLQLDSFTLFANAILIALERGGRVTEALERISISLQENQRLERKLEADTASGRKVIVTLAIFPFAFVGLFSFLDPQGTALIFQSLPGQIVMLMVIGLVYASSMWGKRILAIEM